MLIGIDAHNLEGNRTGVGRYLINLLQQWSKLDIKNQKLNIKYILYFKKEIPVDLPKAEFFENKLLKIGSTAKFMHWNLPRQAKKDKIDILFCPGYIAPIGYKGKIALALHDIIYEAHPDWFNWRSPADKILLKWVSKISARKANLIFVPSEFTRQEVLKYYKVAAEKVRLIYLAADSEFTSSQPSPWKGEGENAIRKKFHIDDKFIFYVGSIFERRHLKSIVEAFEILTKEQPDYQLLLGGRDHTNNARVDKFVHELNLLLKREAVLRVDFIGDSDLKLLYGGCAFFIWLSDYEGFGLPPLEAMSVGAPVITSDATSLKEVAGQAALLIKNNSNVEEIYQAMNKIISDDNLRRELAAKGREQAVKFSWEKCATETLEKLKMN